MRILFAKRFLWYLILFITLCAIGAYGAYALMYPTDALSSETALVERGTIAETITISGKVEALQSADVAFPIVGTVQNVYKTEGDHVTQGEIIASLTQNSIVADYSAALENVHYLERTKAELMRGPKDEDRATARTNVEIATANLMRIQTEHAQIVQNARALYLSSGLEMVPESKTNDDVPPTVSGNYSCGTEGIYTISIYSSGAKSGHSYTFTGLEEGKSSAYTDVPSPLGTCGLFVQFDGGETYRPQNWTISIPNTKSSAYVTNLNAYKLALQQQGNAVSAAQQALTLAENTERGHNAPPSTETIAKIDAQIAQARALLLTKEALIADYTIRAPFDAVITNSDIKIGETVTPARTATLVKEGLYKLTARIPEIDITKVQTRDRARVVFDAASHETLEATITFISPAASEVDGSSYYEAHLTLDTQPAWMRAGLNADVDIITEENSNVLRLPKQFIGTDTLGTYVLVQNGRESVRTPVHTGVVGNDGFTEVLDLSEGTRVLLP